MLSFECRVSPKAYKTRGWPRSLQLLNPHFLWLSGPSAPGQGLSRKPQYSFLPRMIHLVMSCLGPDYLRACWPQVKTRVFCFFSFVQIKNILSVKTSQVLYDCILLLICYGYKEKETIYLVIGLSFSSFQPQQESIAEKVVVLGERVLAF